MNQQQPSKQFSAANSLLENFLIHAVANDDRERALRVAAKVPGPYSPIPLAAANPVLFYAVAMLMSWGDAHAAQAVRLIGAHVHDGPDTLADRARDAMFGAAVGMAESALHVGDVDAVEQFFALAAIQPERISAYSRSFAALALPVVRAVAALEKPLADRFPQFNDPWMTVPSTDHFQYLMGPNGVSLGLIGRIIALLDTHGYCGPAELLFKVALQHASWPSWRALEFYAVRQPNVVINFAGGALLRSVGLDEGARRHLGAFTQVAMRTLNSNLQPLAT